MVKQKTMVTDIQLSLKSGQVIVDHTVARSIPVL